MLTNAVQLDFFSEDPNNRPMLLSHVGEGVQNDCGMKYYNEAILLNPIASASMRAEGNMKTRKLVKVHQNILVFKKD